MGVSTGIIGATGYTGYQLTSILMRHTHAEVSWITSEKYRGNKLPVSFPHLADIADLDCLSVSEIHKLKQPDVVFSCLPAGVSIEPYEYRIDI